MIETLLLVALPASGKSEVRKYLASVSPEVGLSDFHLGPTVQLDDFPYVHMMRRIDDALRQARSEPIFFRSSDKPFLDPRDWGTLIELLNEDHDDLVHRRRGVPAPAAGALLDRIDRARSKVGAEAVLGRLPRAARESVCRAIEEEASDLARKKADEVPGSLEGRTVVIEFARGGPEGAKMPLAAPFGYAHSFSLLSPAILEKARILYIWVTPEESRRKNRERANPDDPGSILHHGVPEDVMRNDYGCDDVEHLLSRSSRKGTVPVAARGRTFHVPLARFDNRADKTSFVRNDRRSWTEAQVKALHGGLAEALGGLAAAGR
jgi:hypothetical protein